MKTDTELTRQRADCQEGRVLALRQRSWLVIAALWLQAMVVVFVILETTRRIKTPVTDWMDKIAYLLGI
jgi:hypothetical protein